MAGYFENFSREPVHLLQRGEDNVWHRMDEDGRKQKGNHKPSKVTDAPEVYSAKFHYSDERLRQLAGKLNRMLKNVGSKTQSYNYKEEVVKWANEFKKQGGTWRAEQDNAVKLSLAKNPSDRDWFAAIKHNFNLPDVDNGIGHPAGEPDQIDAPPAAEEEPMVARRPEDTPTRPPVSPKRRRLNNSETQVTQPPTGTLAPTAAPSSEASIAAELPTAPAPAAPETQNPNMAGKTGAVGVDPSGGLPFEPIISQMPQHDMRDGKEFFTFGGTRIMYTWAYEFFPGTIPAVGPFVANANDGVAVGHQLPWEWIPFYCTPTEFEMLPYRRADIYVDKVRVRVTPMAKETQFQTGSGSTAVASQEHLTLGKVCVGLNHKWNNVGQLRLKEAATDNKLQSSASDLQAVNYKDLRKRFWGNLSDWTSGTSPYGSSTVPKSTMEMNIRELENVQVMLWDKWNTTDQGANDFCWGVPLIDRFITRFPFMPSIGKAIIDEEYSPRNGCIFHIKNVPICKTSFQTVQFFGDENTAWDLNRNTKFTNKGNSFSSYYQTYSANSNLGTKADSVLGAYHSTIEKYSLFEPCAGAGGANSRPTQPTIMFGLEPIKPIDPTTNIGTPIPARAMWKIDYQIIFRCERPAEIYHWPYPTHIKPSSSIANPTQLQQNFPPIVRHQAVPRFGLAGVGGFDATNTGQPVYENPTVESTMCQNFAGRPLLQYADQSANAEDVGGKGYIYQAASGGTLGIKIN